MIDDSIAKNSEDIAYSGKFVDDNLLSVSHESHLIGTKTIDEASIENNYIPTFNQTDNKLEYKKADDLIEEIDCGYF
jgi:aldehyde:ferredoxin oxidoreductase